MHKEQLVGCKHDVRIGRVVNRDALAGANLGNDGVRNISVAHRCFETGAAGRGAATSRTAART